MLSCIANYSLFLLLVITILLLVLKYSVNLLFLLLTDAEPSVQEQALGFVRNLVDGCMDSIDYIFAEDGLIINAVAKQVWRSARMEVHIQVYPLPLLNTCLTEISH